MAELNELMDFIEQKAQEDDPKYIPLYMEVFEQLARLEGLEK